VQSAPAKPRRRWPTGDIVLASIAALLALLLIIVTTITLLVGSSNAQAAAARLGTRVKGVDLVAGDCLQDFTQVAGPTFDFELVDCKVPHAAELVLYDTQTNVKNYLGPRAMSDLAQALCDTTLRYGLSVGDLSKYPEAYLFGVFQGRAEWENGNRAIQCYLINRDGSPLVGQFSLKPGPSK
jgi:cytochrome c-type biogenesis protein CcmE